MQPRYDKLLKNRDPAFLNQLFEETSPYLLKFLASQRILGSTAEELIQSAWETFFAKLDKFEGRSQIKVFVAGILLNKVREHRRFQKKAVYEEDSEKIFQQAFSQDGWWNHEVEDPYRAMESKESLQSIQDCMEGLSESQREAFLLREVDGQSTEEICKILGVNVSHLGVLLFRAKDKLRKCLEGK